MHLAYLATTIRSIISNGWFWAAIFKLTGLGDEKTWLELGWNGVLLTLRWNKRILPRDIVFAFLKDWGSVKTWKLLIGIVGFNQDDSGSSPFRTKKGDEISNWIGLHRVGDDWEFLIFLFVLGLRHPVVKVN